MSKFRLTQADLNAFDDIEDLVPDETIEQIKHKPHDEDGIGRKKQKVRREPPKRSIDTVLSKEH